MLAALGFLRPEVLPENMPRALLALHRWLDSWAGIGAVERGMHRQGYDLALTRYTNDGWRPITFCNSGKEHSPTGATGSAWGPMPRRAVQRAAWEALNNAVAAAA
jgi:ribosomal protein S12 methylthiotransferase accessory factor YcaO